MTHEEFQEKIKNIPDQDLIKKADEALTKLCKTGARSFKMTVPPRIDDTDIVFAEVINRFKNITEKQ